MKLPCVLLAAGDSTRMGRDKLLVSLGGETVVHRAARNALDACFPLIVVTGDTPGRIENALADLAGIRFVHNLDWRQGMVSSAIAGLAGVEQALHASGAEEGGAQFLGFFLHHADMPFVTRDIYEILSAEAWKLSGLGRLKPLVPACRGIPGHPVFFPYYCIEKIRGVEKGESLKSVLADSGFSLVETASESVNDDCDTPEDFMRHAAAYGLDLDLADPIGARVHTRSET